MSRPNLFPVGRHALAWIRRGKRPTRCGRLQMLMIRWQSLWFDYNRSLQERLPVSPPIKTHPIFILGMWRSGTTYLHELLAGCPGHFSPETWQCMNPTSFRLQRSPPRMKFALRPMDGLPIDTLSPQEDEFALMALGVPSTYLAFFDPRRLPELEQWLDPRNWLDTHHEKWLEIFQTFLRDVAGGRNGTLVLKSPAHSFRIAALIKEFPESKFIWLVRDPHDTLLSNRKMWLSMFMEYGLWDPDPRLLDVFLEKSLLFAVEGLKHAVSNLERDRLIVLRFEQLTDATVETIARITDRLHIGDWTKMLDPVLSLAGSRKGHRVEKYDRGPLPDGLEFATHKYGLAINEASVSHGL